MLDKCVAVITDDNGKCKYVGEVRNVDKNKYNALLNEQCEHEQFLLNERARINNKFANHKKHLTHLENNEKLFAKTIYDNFVDRGFIDNDNDFQQMWYDYFFNNGELDLSKAPREYNIILEKVGSNYEEEND